MKAIVLNGTIDDPLVELVDVEPPIDEPGRVVIDVVSAGISWMEPRWITHWRNADGTARPRPEALGLEYAGRIRSLGGGVEGHHVGQDVMGMLDPYRGGAMAERVTAEARHVVPMPKGLSHEQASSLPLSGMTAWQALVRHGGLRRGQRVLIHGGAGAVGTFAVQIARWIGARVTVTASAKDDALCRSLGADEVVDHRRERFEDLGGGYDLVFDQVGGDVQERSWSVLKHGGRLVTIAGEETDAPDQARARELGVTALFFIVDQDVDALRILADLVVAGPVRPVISERLPLATAAEAFIRRGDRLAGKALLVQAGRDGSP